MAKHVQTYLCDINTALNYLDFISFLLHLIYNTLFYNSGTIDFMGS